MFWLVKALKFSRRRKTFQSKCKEFHYTYDLLIFEYTTYLCGVFLTKFIPGDNGKVSSNFLSSTLLINDDLQFFPTSEIKKRILEFPHIVVTKVVQ